MQLGRDKAFAEADGPGIVGGMFDSLTMSLAATAALLPAVLLPLRRDGGRDGTFWALLLLAVVGPLVWAVTLFAGDWNASLTADLWVGIAASLVVYAVTAAIDSQAWRLLPLLAPYLFILGALATVFATAPQRPLSGHPAWLEAHIVVSVLTLGGLTLASVAALASFLQARALKLKRPTGLTRLLPPVAASERLSERLLLFSELVLFLGVGSGMATAYRESGSLLTFNHKTLFTLIAFVVIGLLLIGRRVCGVRGQVAARVVLLSYLLIILGYFGVKFVHQVLLS